MIVKLQNNSYTANVSDRLLGYQGETNAREIQFSGLEVEGADVYKMRVQYDDGVAYEVDITRGSYSVDGSLLRVKGYANCQIFACKTDSDGKYTLVKKSNIFKLEIKDSLNNNIKPIPTFEQAGEALDKVLKLEVDTSTDREAVAEMLSEVKSTAENVDESLKNAEQNIEEKATAAENAAQRAEEKAEEISGTASTKLDKIIKSANLYNPEAIEEGYAQSGINKMENADYFITEQIHVDVSKGNLFCGIANEDGTLTAQVMRFALFVSTDGVTKYLTQKATTVEIPTDTAYFVATFPNTVKGSKIYIGYGTSCEGVTYQPYGEFDVLATLKKTNAKTLENTEQVNTLTAIDDNKISSIMKPLFTDGSNLQIKLIGDSITMGAQGTGVNDADENNDLIYTTSTRSYYENTAGHCWANSLRDYFAEKFGCTVKNYGVTGSTSWAILNYIDDIVRDEDDICIVCIGINDRQKATKDETKTRIRGIYDAITAKGKKCILMSPIPMSATNEAKYDERDYHANDVDIIYQSIATELNIEYIPLYKLLNQYITSHGITLDSILASDLIHPNDNGYDIIFGLVSNALGVPTKFENPADDMTFAELNAKFVNANSELAETKAQLAETQAEIESLKTATETVEAAAETATAQAQSALTSAETATEQANIATAKAAELAESVEQIASNTSDIDTLKESNDLFDDMLQITQTANLLNPDKLEYGKTINSSGNVVDTTENKAVSEQIKVDNSIPLKITTVYAQALYQYKDDGTLITYTTAFSSSESLTLDAETTFVRIVVWVSRLPFMLYQSNDDLTYVDFGIYSKSVRKIINIYATDTEEEILDKMYSAYNAGNCDVYWEYGTYEFDSAYDLVKTKYSANTAYELPIGNNCRYFFNGSTIKGTYTGFDSNIGGNCSVFGSRRQSGSYELNDGIIEATDIIYCVHDEANGSSEPYLRKYNNIQMKYISGSTYTNSLSKCIGGGTGLKGMVDIRNCYFESDNSTNPEVSYHGHSLDDETVFKITISNSYFEHSFGAHALATNETAELIFSGNSVLSIPTENTSKWTIKSWNNEVRS